MSDTAQVWLEISFDVLYLVVVWGLVLLMKYREEVVTPKRRQVAKLIRYAFSLLAFGDTFHVGSRVVGYFMPQGLDTTIALFGRELGLVGWATFVTAVTVSLFYIVFLMVWREQFKEEYGVFSYFLFLMGVVRLALLLLPQNQWNQQMSVQPWSTIRSIPLIILGLGVAYLILRSSVARGDKAFLWIGIMILVSYACFLPVVLFVQKVPLLGMLMIPKTIAYVAVGFIAYFDLYK